MIDLDDSSEFHGSSDREWKYKIHKFKQILTPKVLKYTLYFILWFALGRVIFI